MFVKTQSTTYVHMHVTHVTDNISPRILEELADEISPLLQLIYTKFLYTGEELADWRTANVSPV